MKAAYGIDYSKGSKIAMYIFIVLYIATLIYLGIVREWGGVVSFSLNLVVFYFILRRNANQYIQITENNRLMLGVAPVEIKAIDRIEYYNDGKLRVYYNFNGEPRLSPKVKMKEADKDDFISTLCKINPNIQIN